MVRKVFSVILASLVMFFTIISVLAIWDIIDIERVFQKSMATLLVLFISSAIMLFIFAVIYKPNDETQQVRSRPQARPIEE